MMNQLIVKNGGIGPVKGFSGFIRSRKVLGFSLAVINYIFIFFLLTAAVLPKQYSLKVGDIMQNPISAPWDVEDARATDELRQIAKDNVSSIYRFDEHISESVMEEVENIFETINEARRLSHDEFLKHQKDLERQQILDSNPGQDEETDQSNGENLKEASLDDVLTEEFISQIGDMLPIILSKDEIMTCLKAEKGDLSELHSQLTSLLDKLLDSHIKQENLLEVKNALRDGMMSLPLANEIRILGTSVGVSVLRSNMILDVAATEEEKERVGDNVEPIIYKKGQYIVQAGQPITPGQYHLLQDLGLLKDEKLNFPILFGIGIGVLLIETIVILYLNAFEKKESRSPSNLLMMSLIVWMVLGLSLAVNQFNLYLIPAALGAMLLTILISPGAAMVINIALALLFGIIFDGAFSIILMTIGGGVTGIYMCSKAKQRNGLIWAGITVSCINFACIFGLKMISSERLITSFKTSAWGMGGGLLSGIFLIGTLPVWENLFGVVTPIKLVELANPNHPILKRMLMEAPGTYHHSIIVANLAENAAEAIGADGLLARVGAYYHDIGKLKRPFYFKENQIAMENPHDKLSPSMSTHIIISHAKDGIELARRHKIPKVIQDFILEHHGTTTVAYFYYKAKELDGKENINIEDFRYPGPKPRKRETAIVMMADTVEAAVRSIQDPTPEKVEDLIRKLVKSKLDDGQLDDCHLTLKDINTISNAFSGVMTGFFHERVQYPKIEENRSNE